MAHERLHPTFQFDEERLNQLRQIAPEAFADGKINWETFRGALGEHLEEESADTEHFGLFWPGKRQARRIASLPSTGTLAPVYGEGLKADGTPDTDGHNDSHNVFIEGENLEVLKLLQKSYAGRIKMIYIDPPYNTGNDFIYDDDFTEPLQEYLRRTGQMDEDGKALTTNKKADGRFHSKWLSMMYPRLRLARNLLQEDGSIFVSIDDTEVHHLRMIMNEVFGEENKIGTLVWQSKKGGGSDSGTIVNDHEYVLCYSKNVHECNISKIQIGGEELNLEDEKGPYRRGRELNKWGSNSRREDRKTMWFPIYTPQGDEVYPIRNDGEEGCWRYGKKRMMEFVEKGNVEFVKRPNGTFIAYEKIRTNDPRLKPYRTWLTEIGATSDGSKMLKELFDGKKVFDFPKPVNLIKALLAIGSNDDKDIILDFFAGSATTAQAIFDKNIEDEVTRYFVMVQMPETCDPISTAFNAGFKNISEITKERIRRISNKLGANLNSINNRALSDDRVEKNSEDSIDLGFKSLNLQNSNFKPWQNYHGQNPSEVEDLFSQFEDPLKEGWTEDGLTTEVVLTEGFPLDSRIEIDPAYGANRVRRISSDFHEYSLLMCLDSKINADTITRLDLGSNDVFICLDRAITDQEKLRLSDKGLLKTI